MSDVKVVGKQVARAFTAKAPQSDAAVADLVSMADTARREGLLALEERLRGIEDPFLRQGIEMTVDGTDADEIHDVLHARISSKKRQDKLGIKFFADMGGYAPTIGIIGTVIGLIHVLGSLSSPEKLGSLIGAAFTATLWGVMSANVAWIPIENKLKRLSEIEVHNKLLILDGILAIQAGDSPRMVEQHLLTYVAPKDRVSERGFKAA